MYTPLPKGHIPKLEKILVHEDFESWSHEDFLNPMYVDKLGMSLLEQGLKPNQITRYYIKDSENFVWQVLDKQTGLWIWDNYKQAGEPELCILSHGPFDDYVDSVVDKRSELETLDSNSIVAVALGYDQ